MNRITVLDMTATGSNITRTRENTGLTVDDIIDVIRESVDVIEVLKPIYNFKAN